jgi:predicted phage baseplate assembly protein
MPLPLPQLDNYTFDTLVAEAQALLPRFAPPWTDYNAHDPGITLIELFAWITEMESYRLDRVSEASQRAFLRLVGIEPKPAQVAETVLVVAQTGMGLPIQLPAGSQFTTSGKLTFQTADPVWISPAKLVAVLTGATSGFSDSTQSNVPSLKQFPPFGKTPQVGDALYLGFDQNLAENPAILSLYICVGDPDVERQTKAALQSETDAIQKEGKHCPSGASATSDWSLHYGVRTRWEYYAGADQWMPLADVSDNTRACTLSGKVVFTAPDPAKHVAGGVASTGQGARFFIRCRLMSGSYDCPPQIRYVQINAVLARHAVDVATPYALGVSNGQAGQVFSLPESPIVPGSTALEVRLGATVEHDWKEQLWWDRVGPYDRGYVLDPESGKVSFGNGRSGFVPAAHSSLSVTYQIGGGSAGNVPANTAWSSNSGTAVEVSQPFSASGGADAESLFDAQARAVAWLTIPQRAITLDDFERLALETPGVPVARAKALADYDPELHCVAAPGSVTVVVVSNCASSQPIPGDDLLRAVMQYLDRRRLLTTELHVTAPDYTTVSVQAKLHATSDVVSRDLISLATQTLNDFLDPLQGGPDGSGWPIGRAVYRTEILAKLNALPGVLYVDGVNLESTNITAATPACCSACTQTAKALPAGCGNVETCPHGLVAPGPHRITVSTERVA